MAFESKLDLQLPETPQVVDSRTYAELLRIYNAFKLLQEEVERLSQPKTYEEL